MIPVPGEMLEEPGSAQPREGIIGAVTGTVSTGLAEGAGVLG